MASSATALLQPFSSHIFTINPPTKRRLILPITATSENQSQPAVATVADVAQAVLPIKSIPGDYGLPIFGAIRDRRDFFYDQGRDEFFKSRMRKYESTVFRVNMPPGPPIASDPRVIVLLDGKSFPVLFDVSKVEKKDLFLGTYMPSTELTGGYRVLSFLDPSESKHEKVKNLLFFLLKERRDHVIPALESLYGPLFESMAKEITSKGEADFSDPATQTTFNFVCKAFFGTEPEKTQLGSDGPGLIKKWLLFQLAPIMTLGLPKYIDDTFLRTIKLPPFLIKKDYSRLYEFFFSSCGFLWEEARRLGLSTEEACHNILFASCFNTFGGLLIVIPNMMRFVGQAGPSLHAELATEIRAAIASNGGKVTMAAMNSMPLVKSVVYETYRIEPPVPFQYGKAKQDLIVESHDTAFEVKAGEMLFGYQPFATRDPRIFDKADEFVPDRFSREGGQELLKQVFWSNGRQTDSPTTGNKQCAGKDFVMLVSQLFLVELFRHYDSYTFEMRKSQLILTSLKKASI